MTRIRIETIPVRVRMRQHIKAILSAVRQREWGEVAVQDGLLKRCEEEIIKIEVECAKKDEEAKAKSAAARGEL